MGDSKKAMPSNREASDRKSNVEVMSEEILENKPVSFLVKKAISELPSGDFTVHDIRNKVGTFVSKEHADSIISNISTETSVLARKGMLVVKQKGMGGPTVYHKD